MLVLPRVYFLSFWEELKGGGEDIPSTFARAPLISVTQASHSSGTEKVASYEGSILLRLVVGEV